MNLLIYLKLYIYIYIFFFFFFFFFWKRCFLLEMEYSNSGIIIIKILIKVWIENLKKKDVNAAWISHTHKIIIIIIIKIKLKIKIKIKN